MTTTDALALLKDLGADPAGEKVRTAIDLVRDRITCSSSTAALLRRRDRGLHQRQDLAAGAYFGAVRRLLDRLLSEQLEDGGWNCEAPKSKRSSFHSTICVLEGLLAYEKARGPTAAVTHARARAEDYLLQRRMLRSLSSGEVIDGRWTRFAFPPIWHYDVLRGLDYLRGAGVEPDERVAEAVELVASKRDGDGRWLLDLSPRSPLSFDCRRKPESPGGSAAGTLRALRVLDW
jgi:hypothetical protein